MLDVMFEVMDDLLEVDELQDVLEVFFGMCDEHALAAAARYRLQDDGIADFLGGGERHLVVFQRGAALGHRYAGRRHGGARRILVADEAKRLGHGADPDDAGLRDHLGEVSVLGKKAVAWMNGFGLGLDRRFEHGLLVEIAFRRIGGTDAIGEVGELDVQGVLVGIGIDGDRLDAKLLAGADDADGDFAAIGDENSPEHKCSLLFLVLFYPLSPEPVSGTTTR